MKSSNHRKVQHKKVGKRDDARKGKRRLRRQQGKDSKGEEAQMRQHIQ